MDEIVYQVNPALGTAVYKANLNQSSKNTIEQYSYLFKKHRELLNLEPEDASTQYQTLDPQVQGALTAVFGMTDYSKKPVDWTLSSKIWNGIKSPFRGLFGAAVGYSKAINLPGAAIQQEMQGVDSTEFFSRKTWMNGWDGTNMFDQAEVNKLDNTYGKTIGIIAKGLAQGQTPGEIVAAEGGQLNEEMVRALDMVFTQPEVFEPILNQYKRAQLSPGRTFARKVLGNSSTENSFYSIAFNVLSGVSDAAYQIAIDPLTYATLGVGSIARISLSKGARLAELGKRGRLTLPEIFSDAEVVSYWDEFGPVLQDFITTKDPVKREAIRTKISREFPEYDNDSSIRLLGESGVKDAKSALKFFDEDISNINLLFSGRVFSTDKFRGQSVAAATKTRGVKRQLVTTLGKFWDNNVQPVSMQDKEIFGKDFMNIILSVGEDTALASGKLDDLASEKALQVAKESVSGLKGMINRFRIHPGIRGIKFLDKDVDETLDVVESVATTVMAKPLARIYAQTFRDLPTVGDRVQSLRGLYALVMHRMGLSAMEGGDQFIARQLEVQFGDAQGFFAKQDSLFPQQFLDNLTPDQRALASMESNQVPMSASGAVHAYNETPIIGQLDWIGIGEFVSGRLSREGGGGKVTEFLRRLGNLTNSKTVKAVNDNWSFFTLAPKLGIKSTLDEQLFFSLFATKEIMFNYLSLKGRKAATIAGVFAGKTSKSIGYLRDKLKGYSGSIDDEARAFLAADARTNEEFRNLLGLKAIDVVKGRNSQLDEINERRVLDALTYNPHASDAATSTTAARSGLGGRDDAPYVNLDKDGTLTARIEAAGGKGTKLTNVYRLTHDNLDKRQRGVAQWKELILRFGYNDFRLGPKKVYWNPTGSFFRHNGLQTSTDVRAASDEAMELVGFRKNPAGQWEIGNEVTVKRFTEGTADGAVKLKQGKTHAQIAQERINLVLADLSNIFNGGSEKAFNQRLWNLITSKTDTTQDGAVTLKRAFRDLDFEDFFDTSSDNLLTGPFKTNIEFAGQDSLSAIAKGKEWTWDKMDRQITALHRAPAWWSMYLAKREVYDQFEKDYVEQLIKKNPGMRREYAETISSKRFTEIAGQEATGELLKFVDDPSLRSQLAWSARNIGRFYRATEDFMRRIYRLRKATLPVLYRMRLASLGLDGSGFVHTDQQGERYVVMPMDDFIFQAVNPVFTAISGGKKGYLQPSFNDFTLKLAFANPSLSADAAMPTLSGPIAAGSVWLFKSIVGNLPGGAGDVLADKIDNMALGSIGDNLTLRRAIIPITWDRTARVFSSDEKDKQEITAIHQAIAYNQANGLGLSPTATPEERYQYQKQIKITAHNVVALRNIIGLTPLPFSVSSQESQDVPNYLKEVGIGAIRQEFFDLYENLSKAPNPRQDDLYEEALVAFVGQNPNRLVYTVSRNDKVRKIAFQKTDEVKNWMLKNQDLINTYGDVAFLTAPTTGEFSPSAYAWFEAAGLLKSRDLESFLNEVQVAVDRQRYFDAEDKAFESLRKTADPAQQAIIKNATQRYRDALRISNPLLDYALQQGDFGISKQEQMLVTLKQMLADPNVKISKNVREKLMAGIEITDDSMTYFEMQNATKQGDYVTTKKIYRNNALSDLNSLSKGDTAFGQAKKVIFEPMLRFKSRDVL
jgi:hypothetical protein